MWAEERNRLYPEVWIEAKMCNATRRPGLGSGYILVECTCVYMYAIIRMSLSGNIKDLSGLGSHSNYPGHNDHLKCSLMSNFPPQTYLSNII